MTQPAYPGFPQLGRVLGPEDKRDELHPMQAILTPLTAEIKLPTSRYWYPGGVPLNQGTVGACVGFTGANWMQNSPIRTPVTNQMAFALYYECKKIDGIPNIEGTYARALLEVLRNRGVVERYLWANTPKDLKDWVLGVGPVLVGTIWRSNMFTPAPSGFVPCTGSIVGGHEYLVRGYSNPLKAYRCRNSWGDGWGVGKGSSWAGKGGEFWIREQDLNTMIWGGGENWGDAIGIVEA